MKIIGISCSPKKGRSTYAAMRICLDAAEAFDASVETELVELADPAVGPCIDCGICKQGLICGIDDGFSVLIEKLADPSVTGLIVGTPVYFGTMTAQCKAFLDRCVVFRRNGWVLRDKVGGVLAVGRVRNGGQELTLQAVRAAMLCHDMVCVSDGKGTAHFGAALWSGGPGGVETDELGMETARNLGRRVAEVALQLTRPTRAG